MSLGNLLIYGSNGYTGTLIARNAVKQGLRPIIAGRSKRPIASLASELGLESRSFTLDDPLAVDAGLANVSVVLNCAGPFSHTYKPMVDGCLRNRVNYLDITGEIPVLEAIASLDAQAKSAGVMLLPAIGFDVVPSDCLAAHLETRLPSATRLTLGLRALGKRSRGTSTTMIENIHDASMVRRDGVLTSVPAASKTKMINFGKGPVSTTLVAWADLSTAYYSTHIPNIEVYLAIPSSLRRMMMLSRYLGWVLEASSVQWFLKRQVQSQPLGPTDEERAKGLSLVWGEVEDDAGNHVSSLLQTPESYALTALTAVEAAKKVLAGSARPGFQTPSRAYGADFILGFEGVTRSD